MALLSPCDSGYACAKPFLENRLNEQHTKRFHEQGCAFAQIISEVQTDVRILLPRPHRDAGLQGKAIQPCAMFSAPPSSTWMTETDPPSAEHHHSRSARLCVGIGDRGQGVAGPSGSLEPLLQNSPSAPWMVPMRHGWHVHLNTVAESVLVCFLCWVVTAISPCYL